MLSDNFRGAVDHLNRQVTSDSHILLPDNNCRAYRMTQTEGDLTFFGDGAVHVANIGEEHYGRIVSINESKTVHKGGLYAGVGGFVNLSYIGALQASSAILFDLNAYQKFLWDEVIDAIARNPTAEGFKAQLPTLKNMIHFNVSSIFADPRGYRDTEGRNTLPCGHVKGDDPVSYRGIDAPEEFQQWIDDMLRGDRLWEEYYDHLHQLAKDDKLGAITLDVCDSSAAEQLSEFLTSIGSSGVDYLYTSNVFNYLERDRDRWSKRGNTAPMSKKDQAEAALATILSPNSLIISARDIKKEAGKRVVVSHIVAGSHGNGLNRITI